MPEAPRAKREYTLFPYTTLCRAAAVARGPGLRPVGGIPEDGRVSVGVDSRRSRAVADGALTPMGTFIRYSPLLIIAIAWELAPRLGLVSELLLPPFSTILIDGASLFETNEIYYHIGSSLFRAFRSEEHTSELQSLMRISYAVF